MTSSAHEITRSSLRDQVLAVLRQRLVSGDLQPGHIYSAQAVAAELGVSGSPVREAMLTLVNQGLMVAVRNRGFQVVDISEQDRADIHEMRLWLEIPAMRKLAASAEEIRTHEAHFRSVAYEIITAAKDGDVSTFLELDRQFHLGLIDLLGSRRLTTAVGELRDQTRLYGLEKLNREGRLVPSSEEHVAILDALYDGNCDRTAELMTAHMDHVLSDWASPVQRSTVTTHVAT